MQPKNTDLPLQLVDRDLATTLRRSYASVPWYKRMYLMAGLALGMVSSEEIDEESIEKLKEGDILESTFTEFAEQSPELYEALIAERDRYMAARLREENLAQARQQGAGSDRRRPHGRPGEAPGKREVPTRDRADAPGSHAANAPLAAS